MTQAPERTSARVPRGQIKKFEERRAELAASTLQTLAELGYARTSLREIAQNSEYSHGVLHYYFTGKVDLITHSVRQYEEVCVTRYDELVEAATSAQQLNHDFAHAMAQTLRADAPIHRLWYDMRNQSLFDDTFRKDVLEIDGHRQDMIARVADKYAELRGRPLAVQPACAYASLDGLFQRCLLHYLAGNDSAPDQLIDCSQQLMEQLVER